MQTQDYLTQSQAWPHQGRHILARYDDRSVWVYQAYRPAIAEFALARQQFGGEFSFARMSWIKPNFLWMMYRSGWAAKAGQEYVLAVRLRRGFFDEVLAQAVPSAFDPARYDSPQAWQQAVAASEVRLQWDPDHAPDGRALPRRAVQLGLRGTMLRRYGTTELLEIADCTPFVLQQRALLASDPARLLTPLERVYPPATPALAAVLGLDPHPSGSSS